VRCRGDHIVLLPVIQVPSLAIAANGSFLWSRSNALVVATGTTAHDEDLLCAVQLVDGDTDQHVGHGVGDCVLVDTGVGKEGSTREIAADIGVAVRLAAHQLVVRSRERLQGVHDDTAKDTAQVSGLFEGVILAIEYLLVQQYTISGQESILVRKGVDSSVNSSTGQRTTSTGNGTGNSRAQPSK
jgi:hypothetical protein